MPELATNKDALESVDRNFVVKLDASESNFKINVRLRPEVSEASPVPGSKSTVPLNLPTV